MKKNKLIELLQAIKGNPDILFYNGFAEDWQEIIPKLNEQILFKESLPHYLESVRQEQALKSNNSCYELSEAFKSKLCKQYSKPSNRYNFNDFITKDDVKSGAWLQKRVFFLEFKARGLKKFGTNMEY